MEEKTTRITVDQEFVEILKLLEEKVKHATWDGIEKLNSRILTKILARKIKRSKLF